MAHKRFDPAQLGRIGPDIDLDEEEVYTADGRRLTKDLAQQIAEEAIALHRGRPSVTGRPERTPNLTVRVPQRTREALEAVARAQGQEARGRQSGSAGRVRNPSPTRQEVFAISSESQLTPFPHI
ncbi:MAG: hypothetical protein ACYDD6_02325 [Acidimicrobiales bacterium]